VVDRKHRTSRVWGGLCLAALSLATGTPLLAAEAGKAPSVEASVRMPPMELDAQSAEPDFASLGGALYNPFSPAFETAASLPSGATAARHEVQQESFGLVTTTLAAFVAAGLLVVLVRFLAAG
jgi:hypothetical protein